MSPSKKFSKTKELAIQLENEALEFFSGETRLTLLLFSVNYIWWSFANSDEDLVVPSAEERPKHSCEGNYRDGCSDVDIVVFPDMLTLLTLSKPKVLSRILCHQKTALMKRTSGIMTIMGKLCQYLCHGDAEAGYCEEVKVLAATFCSTPIVSHTPTPSSVPERTRFTSDGGGLSVVYPSQDYDSPRSGNVLRMSGGTRVVLILYSCKYNRHP